MTMPRSITITAGVLTFFVAALLSWSTAAAHSGLAAASPGPGAIVGGEVTQVELWYGSAVIDISASITAPDGTVLAGELVQVSELRMTFELDEPLVEPGEYAVRHGTTGVEDGDRIDAAYLFTFDPDAAPPVLLLIDEEGGVSIWIWLSIGAGVVVIGVLVWRLLVSIRRARQASR